MLPLTVILNILNTPNLTICELQPALGDLGWLEDPGVGPDCNRALAAHPPPFLCSINVPLSRILGTTYSVLAPFLSFFYYVLFLGFAKLFVKATYSSKRRVDNAKIFLHFRPNGKKWKIHEQPNSVSAWTATRSD